jgi:hypothetical protein
LSDKQLSALYRISADEYARTAHSKFVSAITHTPPTQGTEALFHLIWDINISWIVTFILSGAGDHIRNNNRDTITASKRPDCGLLVKNHCVFRGEERAPSSTDNPERALLDKLMWSYVGVLFILGLLWILLRFERVLMQMRQDTMQYPQTSAMLQLLRRLRELSLSLITISDPRRRELLIWCI